MHAVLDAGVDPNTRDQAGLPFIFQTLGVNAPMEAITAFLDAGAWIDDVDNHGYTPLMRVMYYGDYRKAELLLARGAAEDRVAEDGVTMAAVIAQNPPREGATVPPAVKAFMDRHRSN
jgi:ankyrin repeat protein